MIGVDAIIPIFDYHIDEGYHAYHSEWLKHDLNSELWPIYEFIIPKGTKYYHNRSTGEVCAEQMIYIGEKRVNNRFNHRLCRHLEKLAFFGNQ